MYRVWGPSGNSVCHSSGSICFVIWHSLSLTLELADPAGLLGQQFPAAYFCLPSNKFLSLGMQVTRTWLFSVFAGIELRSWCFHGKCLTNVAISLVMNHNSQLNFMDYSFFQTLETWSDSFSHLGHHWPDSLRSTDRSRQRIFGSWFLPCGKPAQQDRETPPPITHNRRCTRGSGNKQWLLNEGSSPHQDWSLLICRVCLRRGFQPLLALYPVFCPHAFMSKGHKVSSFSWPWARLGVQGVCGYVCRARFPPPTHTHFKALKDFLAPVGKEPKFPSAFLLPQRIKVISSRKPGLFSVCSLHLFFLSQWP